VISASRLNSSAAVPISCCDIGSAAWGGAAVAAARRATPSPATEAAAFQPIHSANLRGNLEIMVGRGASGSKGSRSAPWSGASEPENLGHSARPSPCCGWISYDPARANSSQVSSQRPVPGDSRECASQVGEYGRDGYTCYAACDDHPARRFFPAKRRGGGRRTT
jgi:hypothetical protein